MHCFAYPCCILLPHRRSGLDFLYDKNGLNTHALEHKTVSLIMCFSSDTRRIHDIDWGQRLCVVNVLLQSEWQHIVKFLSLKTCSEMINVVIWSYVQAWIQNNIGSILMSPALCWTPHNIFFSPQINDKPKMPLNLSLTSMWGEFSAFSFQTFEKSSYFTVFAHVNVTYHYASQYQLHNLPRRDLSVEIAFQYDLMHVDSPSVKRIGTNFTESHK